MKILVLLNPASRNGRGRKLWPAYRAELERRGIDYDEVILCDIVEAKQRAETAAGYDAIAACGGDGTVNAVLNGIMRNPGQPPKLAVFYTGTSPDFCQAHHIPLQPRAAVELLRRGSTRKIDLLSLEYVDEEGERVQAYAGCSCNLAFGAEVAGRANRYRRVLGDRLGTLCALLPALLASKSYSFVLATGGEKQVLENCNHLLFTKIPQIASGLRLDVALEADDGKYALWYACDMNFIRWLKILPGLYRGGHAGGTKIGMEKLAVSSPDPNMKVEYDGDHHGYLPLTVSIAPRSLELFCGG